MTVGTVGPVAATLAPDGPAAAVRPESPVVLRVGPDRHRECYDIFAGALHMAPTTEERWAQVRGLYDSGQVYGAQAPGADPASPILGTLMWVPLGLVLPGGDVVEVACGTFGGVRPGLASQGLASAMLRTQMNDLLDQGQLMYALKPAAAYRGAPLGVSAVNRAQTLRIDRAYSTVRSGLADRMNVRPVPVGTDLMELLPPIQRRATRHPGTIVRSDEWWRCWNPYARVPAVVHTAVAGPPDEPDGYATWWVEYEGTQLPEMRRILHVIELFAASAETATDLWLHLLNMELVEEIRAEGRPLDEDVPLLLTDQRACRVGAVYDDLWVRLIDVPAALNARRWNPAAGEAVVLEVVDDRLPANSGLYRISAEGAERLPSGTPELYCTVGALASLYLGDHRPAQLAAMGMVTVADPTAVQRADRLFATATASWGGTMF